MVLVKRPPSLLGYCGLRYLRLGLGCWCCVDVVSEVWFKGGGERGNGTAKGNASKVSWARGFLHIMQRLPNCSRVYLVYWPPSWVPRVSQAPGSPRHLWHPPPTRPEPSFCHRRLPNPLDSPIRTHSVSCWFFTFFEAFLCEQGQFSPM